MALNGYDSLERCNMVADRLLKYAETRRSIGRNDQYNRLLEEAAKLLKNEPTVDELIGQRRQQIRVPVCGTEIKMSRQEAIFYRALEKRGFVPHETMMYLVLEGADGGDALRPLNHLAVLKRRLVQKLQDLPVEIVNHWGAGYELRPRED